MTTKATITALGVTLTVDSTCKVLLQSLDDALCQAISGKGQAPSNAALSVGVAIGVTLVVVILVATLVAIVIKMRRRRATLKIA